MEYIKTEIDGVWIIQPKVFNDARGYFFEAWKKEEFEQHVGQVDFIQDNESKSSYGVLRGLHYQKGDCSQAKLVRVIKGRVFTYKVDNPYTPQSEASIRFDDPDIAINWPIDAKDILTSAKDLNALSLKEAKLF